MILLVGLLLLTRAPVAAQSARVPPERTTYDAVVAGMQCKQSSGPEPQLDCEYTVGEGLSFVIAGAGGSDAGITVTKATGYASDNYATFGALHGCIIVKPGRKPKEAAPKRGVRPDMAFVSHRNGKVYRTWQECAETK
jgi:hypothetical protein